jgi:hypothetical protein
MKVISLNYCMLVVCYLCVSLMLLIYDFCYYNLLH